MRALGMVFAVSISVFSYVADANAAYLTLTPPSGVVTSGGQISVDVGIGGLAGSGEADTIGAFDLNVTYDPLVLTFSSIAFGTFLGGSSDVLVGFDVDVPTPGVINFAASSLLSSAALDSIQGPSFLLATLLFDAIGTGPVTFGFTGDRRVDDVNGNKIAIVSVPPSILLAVVGFGWLPILGRKWRRETSAG